MTHLKLKNSGRKEALTESLRLASLMEYHILDTSHEEQFDIITEIATRVTGCPMGAISFFDDKRQWFKSAIGLKLEEIPKDHTLCNLTLEDAGFKEIPDISDLNVDLHLPVLDKKQAPRYYGGVPLINSSGYALGTLCVLDFEPRKLPADKIHLLELLARDVVNRLEMRKKDIQQSDSILMRSQKLIETNLKLLEEQKQLTAARQALDEREQLLRTIVDTCPQLIFLKDKEGQYRMINQSMANLLSKEVNDSEKSTDRDFIVREEKVLENRKRDLQVIQNKKGTGLVEEILPTAQGEQWFQTIKVPYEDANGECFVLGISNNITHLKQMELDLQKKNKELENLIYSLSHDLRGPISSILGLLNVEQYASIEDMRWYFSMIREQANKMDSSIHDLVQLKNITNQNVTPREFELLPFLEQKICQISDSGIDIKLICDKEIALKTDPFFIKIALARTLQNAMQFNSKPLKEQVLRIEAIQQAGKTKISIIDNGVGINTRAMPYIFDMFYRGSNLSKGHGLGLYIARSALDRVKATIEVKSVENEGTEVIISIPNVEGRTRLGV